MEDSEQRVGFIGAGNIAQAVVKGLLQTGRKFSFVASATKETSPNYQAMKSLGVTMYVNNVDVVRNCHVLVLAVKPYQIERVLNLISGDVNTDLHVIVSLAALKTLSEMQMALAENNSSRIYFIKCGLVRASITTTVSVRSGVVTMAATESTSAAHKQLVTEIFSLLGHCEMVDTENYVALNTGYAGCNVAYMCMAIEALADGGVLIGLKRTDALQIAAMSMMGAAKMVLETGKHPGELKDAVCSPGGLTIQGIQSLERAGFRSAIIDAVQVTKR